MWLCNVPCLGVLNCLPLRPHPGRACLPRHQPRPQKAHPGEVHAEATVSRMLLGEAMLAALQRRRQVGGQGEVQMAGCSQVRVVWCGREVA